MGYSVSVTSHLTTTTYSTNISHGAMRRALNFLTYCEDEEGVWEAYIGENAVQALLPGYNGVTLTPAQCREDIDGIRFAYDCAVRIAFPEAWVIGVLHEAMDFCGRGRARVLTFG